MVGRRSHSNESGRSAAAPFFFSVRKADNMNCSCARVPNAEAQYPRNFPNASLPPGPEAAMPHPTWSCTTLLLSNSISVNFLNVSRPHVRQFINTEYRKGILLLRRNSKELDDALRVLFTLMQRARIVCCICYNPRLERNTWT